MRFILSIFVFLFPYMSVLADDNIRYDETTNSSRFVRTIEVPYILSSDFSVDSYTMDLTYIEDLSPKDTIYQLNINIRSDRPHALPRGTKLLLKSKEEKIIEIKTSVDNELSKGDSFEEFGEEKWHVCYTFMLNKKQILALSILDIQKMRFQTPWNNSVIDIEKSKCDRFFFSAALYHLYDVIQNHLKISQNIYEDF